MAKSVKPKLIILSDLWGKEKSDWLSYYSRPLNQHFDIQYYDCCELAGIDKPIDTEEVLHHQFINGGIERAIRKLTELVQEETHFLAFSIGGTIAWRFGLETSNIKSLTTISSTRLRYEVAKPRGIIRLWYGKNDHYQPSKPWFEQLGVEYETVNGQGHLIYTDPGFAASIATYLLSLS